MSTRRAALWPIAVLLVAMVSVQSGATLAKQLFPLVGAAGTTVLRSVVGVTLLSFIWRPFRGVQPQDRKYVIAYGLCLGCMNLCFYVALARIPLGPAVALEFTGPLAMALATSRRLIDFVWVVLAATGIVLLSPLSDKGALDPVGALFAVAAGAGWAGYIVFGKRAGRSLAGGSLAASGMFIASFTALPWGMPELTHSPPWAVVLPLALTVGLFSSALPYTLEMVALKQMDSKTFSVLLSMEPAVAALSGLVFLGERLSAVQCLAMGCIMVASAGCSLAARPRPVVAVP